MTLDQLLDPPSLASFDALVAGSPAPAWLASGIVEAWGLPPAATQVRLITVSENATFVVRVDDEPVAVTRVARPGYVADPSAFESEVTWITALGEAGVARVPTPWRTAAGGFVATLRDADGVPWFAVTSGFISGVILEDHADPVPYYREIGRTTALLHEHSASWAPPAGFVRHDWALTDMLGPTARWGRWEDAALTSDERTLLTRAQDAAVSVLEGLGPGPRGLIHADLRPSNIMIDGADLTVIDFDDCGYADFAYDFASALTFMEHVPFAPAMAQEWLAGYAGARPLELLDVPRGCALSMVRRLQMLGWTTTHRSDALPAELWSAQVSGTVEVAARYLDDPEWLLR